MIGGSRPMVSKLLAEMAADGVIARRGRHYVLPEPQPEWPGLARSQASVRALNLVGTERGDAAG
jgi:hypothetical protein